MKVDISSSVIRILNSDGQTMGAGFMVAPGLAVTCAHVVIAAGSASGQKVAVTAISSVSHFIAEVLDAGWSPESLNDVAFLRLDDASATGISPVSLTHAQHSSGHPYLLLGFPSDPTYAERWADGVIHGLVEYPDKERRPVLEMSGEGVLEGMSGGPVLDAHSQRVVGMLTEYHNLDKYRRAYAVSAETIAATCPQPLELQPARGMDETLVQVLLLLDKAAGIRFTGDTGSTILIQGEDSSVVVNLHDEELRPALERKLSSRRDLKSYLLWLTVRPDFLKWDRLFVPLQGYISLPLVYSEETHSEQGPVQKDIEITQALGKHDAFVILGRPGAGKTTTLQKIGFDQARNILSGKPGRIPFFVRLASQEGRPADEFLSKEWNLDTGTSFADPFASGKLLLLLDGINEMAQEGRGERLKAWSLFTEKAVQRGNQVIFTGRELDHSDVLDLPRVIVKPLENEQIRDYLSRRGAEGLWEQIADPQKRLEELASNPFFLNLLVDAYQSGERGLDNRGRLLDWFSHKCFQREKKVSGEGPLPQECCERALGALAFAMQEKGVGTTFKLAQARTALPACVETREGEEKTIDAVEFFRYARGATLLDPNQDILPDIRFFHHLLQEYFAALELNRRFECGQDLSHLWRAARLSAEMPAAKVGKWDPLPPPDPTGWEETTILATGLSKEPAKLIAAVRAINPVLAGRCFDEAGLNAVHALRLGGLHVRLESENPSLAQELVACRQSLLQELYNPQVHLRARLPAGLTLGRLGDPRLEVREKDGMRYIAPDFVLVPAGRYTIGSQDDPEAYDYEKPSFEIDLPAFQVAKRPVTNAEFACFIEADGYQDERWWQSNLAKRWLKGEEVAGGQNASFLETWRNLKLRQDWEQLLESASATPDMIEAWRGFLKYEKEEEIQEYFQSNQTIKSREKPYYWSDRHFNNPSQPVVGLTWFEANAYCDWLSVASGRLFRLPNEFEWEAAARGRDKRKYAWVGQRYQGKANSIEGRVMWTSPVGSYVAAGGGGPHGEEDQTGNVWEWTISLFLPYNNQEDKREDLEAEGKRVLRGGSWDDDQRFARCAYRSRYVPGFFSYRLGFRLFSPGAL